MTERDRQPFSRMLSAYRKRAGLSQLSLSLDAGLSTRHLGFLESSRARPSPVMVKKLATALALTDSERDGLLVAAGFAPWRIDTGPADQPMMTGGAIGALAFDSAVAMATADDPETVVALAARLFGAVGIGQFITGTLRRSADGRWLIERDIAGRPAIGWLSHIEINNYRDRDVLVSITARAHRGFVWEDVTRIPLAADQRRILDEANDFGISSGFVLPVQRGDGSVRALTSWAERLDPADPALRAAAGLVAAALIDNLDRLRAGAHPANAPARLPDDHRDVLGWIGAGRSVAWIAARRSGSEAETHDLIGAATRAMGASTPAQATTRAVALGLLAA